MNRKTKIKQILDSGIIDHLGGEITSMTIARGDDPGTTITSEYQYTDADRAEIKSSVERLYNTLMDPKDTNRGLTFTTELILPLSGYDRLVAATQELSDIPDNSSEYCFESRKRKHILAHLNWRVKHRRRKRYLMRYFKNANWNKDTSGNKRHRPYIIPDYMKK